MTTYDVTIVGAGPAGASLAIRLARAGLRVLLLDKAVFPRDKVCGDFVNPRALRLLDELGCLPDRVQRGYTRIQQSTVFLDGAELSTSRLPHSPGLADYGVAIPRKELDETIFKQAQLEGAECVEGHRVTGVEVCRETVVTHAAARNHARAFASRLVVGADGAQSVIAAAAGCRVQDPRYVMASMRAYATGFAPRGAILHFAEEFFPGFGWIFPIRGGLCNVGVGMLTEPMRRFGLGLWQQFEQMCAFVRRIARHDGTEVIISRPAGWPIKAFGGAGRNYFERGLLIGEAGCFVDPLSGEGIPLALETAELAAATITQCFAAGDFGPRALATYEARWRLRYDVDLKLADLLASILRNRHLNRLWLAMFRGAAALAARDSEFALTTGGILAGVIPTRQALAPEMFLRVMLGAPHVWTDLLRRSQGVPLDDLLRRGVEESLQQIDTLQQLVRDADWFATWFHEINQKQGRLFESLMQPRWLRPG